METDIKILETQEFEVEIYYQTIEVCAVDFGNISSNARVKCTSNPHDKILVMLDLSKINNGVVVHEAVHVAIFITERLGIEFDANTHEHFAYLVEFIFNKIAKIAEDMRERHCKQADNDATETVTLELANGKEHKIDIKLKDK